MNDHDHDYDDEIDDQPTRAEFAAWREGEREQVQREMAERQARIKRDETLAWARQRAERQQPPAVERTFAQRKQDEATAAKHWRDYIRQQLDSRDTALIKAIAQAVVSEEKSRQFADDDLKTIISDVRNRFDEMDARLSELEARLSKRSPAIKCDGNARAFDLDRLRGEWRH